jgi:hypothetical protein
MYILEFKKNESNQKIVFNKFKTNYIFELKENQIEVSREMFDIKLPFAFEISGNNINIIEIIKTQAEVDEYNSHLRGSKKQAIINELAELDKVVSREYENVLKAFDDLKAELETNNNITIQANPYIDEFKLEMIARKNELRNLL